MTKRVNSRDLQSGGPRGHLAHVVRRPGNNPSSGLLRLGGRVWPCRLGQAGITCRKREGDRATPRGRMPIVMGMVRRERLKHRTLQGEMFEQILEGLGWCDEPSHPTYNRPVDLPFTASHEKLKRTDRLYDLILVLNWNMYPRMRNRGSAIFLHVAPLDAQAGTHGCIALEPNHLAQFLAVAERLPRRLPGRLPGRLVIEVI